MQVFKGLFFAVFFAAASGCNSYQGIQWQPYDARLMEQSFAAGKPVVLYFYAAWCGPCHTLKERTFSDPQVMDQLEPYARFKVDMSFIHSKKAIEMAQSYGIEGLPTVIFLNAPGNEVMRFSGYVSAKDMLTFLNQNQLT